MVQLNWAWCHQLKKINYIQNQPLPDAIGKLQTGRTKLKNKTEKTKTLSFQHSWMMQFPWLSFSKLLNGGICKFCVMFPQLDIQHQHTFVTQPFTAYKKALGKNSSLLKHHNSEHHKNAKVQYQTTMTSLEKPSSTLPYRLNKQNQDIYDRNVKILESIVDAVILCWKPPVRARGVKSRMCTSVSPAWS